MTTQPEVNVVTIQTPEGSKYAVAINSGHNLVFTGAMPSQAIGSVATKLLHASRDISRREAPAESSFSQPFSDDQCVPMTDCMIAPTDNPHYFRMAFAFGEAELHIAVARAHLKLIASDLLKLADQSDAEPDTGADDMEEEDTETGGTNPIYVRTAIPSDGRNVMLQVHSADQCLVNTALPSKAIYPVVRRLLDAAVSCAEKNDASDDPLADGFDSDRCVRTTGLGISATSIPGSFGISFAFGATPLHIALPQQELQLLGTGFLAMARQLGMPPTDLSPPPRTSSGWLGRLWGRGSDG
jgi:hypothetical protein